MSHVVFVYGSLKRGLLHHAELDGAEFRGEQTLSGAHLIRYEEGYPASVLTGDDGETVDGELYLVSDAVLKRLDDFEEVPDLYQRVAVALIACSAWAYVISEEKAAPFERLRGPWRGRS